MQNDAIAFPDSAILDQYRTFGEHGPIYHIIEPLRRDKMGAWLLKIEVPATGEVTEYPYDQALTDPIAS